MLYKMYKTQTQLHDIYTKLFPLKYNILTKSCNEL